MPQHRFALLPRLGAALSLTVAAVSGAFAADAASVATLTGARPLVVAHRGASAQRPEHTLAAYALAIEQGADVIEPDLVMTADGVLVARHENEIGDTTDVAAHPAFAARRTTRTIDGSEVSGWFTEDFSLAELRTLRARERLPGLRGSAHDGTESIPTFAEIVELVAREAAARGRTIGLIPEIKHGHYFAARGLAMEAPLLEALAAHAYTRQAPVWIQSFEVANLKALRRALGDARGNVRLLQLVGDPATQPADVAAAGGALTYARMLTPDGLREVAGYADALGPPTRVLMPLAADGGFAAPTGVVRDAHAAGLTVMPWTFRPENAFLPPALRRGGEGERNPAGAIAEMRAYLALGINGLFSDDTALARRAVDDG
ncbi:glycerophosphodiester phosphodiesterase [Coralloluteibacterium stylophorae]|uniref:glycerophosphodiester phosphodiesterase n=1 Tax=Coralloluteibacterium stylophorae TaxID=1776034 RepID=A0AAP2G1U1_9GAMM|nr:glycerophosphodiester phosphodiesterase [Coralloluteibacterium stylophorae]MBS7458028.1 glycerophosphodiester phosphodiesterase [Coralloluteibacterium stylophorae]